MACFIVPAAEAVAVTAISRWTKKREENTEIRAGRNEISVGEGRIPLSARLRKLSGFLWGGSALLLFEHIWHGEVVPWFPFLSAAENPADAVEMLREMATAGVGMAVLVTAAWGVMTFVSDRIVRREVAPAVQRAKR